MGSDVCILRARMHCRLRSKWVKEAEAAIQSWCGLRGVLAPVLAAAVPPSYDSSSVKGDMVHFVDCSGAPSLLENSK